MRLTMIEKRTVTKVFAGRYREATRTERAALLDQFVDVTGYSRNYAARALRLFRSVKVVKKLKRVRATRYGRDVRIALEKIWITLDLICGKRLVAALPAVLDKLLHFGEIEVAPGTRAKLLTLSSATADRLLAPARERRGRRKYGRRRNGNLVDQIPIKTFGEWKNPRPGHVEMDLVAHNGGDVYGGFLSTLNMTDVASSWTLSTVVANKSEFSILKGLFRLKRTLPFALAGIDTDNGSEFINEAVLRFCRKHKIDFTRGRPYKKNDGCFIEQKNHAVVRRNVGYLRYAGRADFLILRELYGHLNVYTNYFQPVMMLVSKTRDGARVSRRYDVPQTPYQRILARKDIPRKVKTELRAVYVALNPAELRRRMDKLQGELLKNHERPETRGKRNRSRGIRRPKHMQHTTPASRREGSSQPNPFLEKARRERMRRAAQIVWDLHETTDEKKA